jgi:hypothetical protein
MQMLTKRKIVPFVFCSLLCACGGGGAASSDDGVSTDVATSVVSGSLNNSTGTNLGYLLPKERPSMFARILDELSPIRNAWAASWMCSGDSLSPTFAGPGSYAFTPVSCQVTWLNGKSASSKWSGTFNLNYGSSCDSTHALMENQAGGCTLTRTTASGGDTRTITGPDGSTYAITHDTNGAGSGWDSTVAPAPANGGVVRTCDASGCSAGSTLVVNGSHITGTVTIAGGQPTQIWNHTVNTSASGLTITGSGTSRSVSGTVTVQHNILMYDATATFNAVTYSNANCCFPTGGSVTTSFHSGSNSGKTESLAFTAICGEATLTTASGKTEAYTLQHCL